ncbi:MAG TPA: hypothetical protein VIL01_05030, partial [Thermomicrobiales bacterium]
IVNCRMQARGAVPRAPLAAPQRAGTLAEARVGTREVYFGAEHGWVETPVYARHLLDAQARVTGPAVIEEMSSTVVLAPAMQATVDALGNIVVKTQAAP